VRFFGVALMGTGRLTLSIIGFGAGRFLLSVCTAGMLLLGCLNVCRGVERSDANAEAVAAKDKPDAQLRLYKEALTSDGSSDQMRVNAAELLLASDLPQARAILLDTLSAQGNGAARAAVCRVLSRAGRQHETVRQAEDFIEPLVEVLRTDKDPTTCRLAAQAMLLFEYDAVSVPLVELVSDTNLPAGARINGVNALKLQPDSRAVLELLKLVDDPQPEVAASARAALEWLGIPVAGQSGDVEQLRSWLCGQDERQFLRMIAVRWVIRGGELEDELSWWKRQYVGMLEKAYSGIGSEAERGKFLVEQLRTGRPIVRLWALEKISQLRIGGQSELPGELGPILIGLIGDSDRRVRLETARVLSLMGELNCAEQLLNQLRVEQDEQVRIEMFVALGVAVNYAMLPNSPVKVAAEVKRQTMAYAGKFLYENDPRKVRAGAEVITKLLERNGVEPPEVERYLNMLVERYKLARGNTDELVLGGELLGKMASLCAAGSACQTQAGSLFGGLFEEAVTAETELLRQAAVRGLIHLDKNKAWMLVKQNELLNDPSPEIRRELLNLAADVAAAEDLRWLWGRVGVQGDGDLAWEAMLKVFGRSELAVLSQWVETLGHAVAAGKLDADSMLSFLEMVEHKAAAEQDTKVLVDAWRRLVRLCKQTGKFERAAEYLGRLHEAARSADEKAAIVPELLDAYLRWPRPDKAAELITNCLLTRDLDPNSAVVQSIERYLQEPEASADPNKIVGQVLEQVGEVADRPGWKQQVQRWKSRLGRSQPKKAAESADQPG